MINYVQMLAGESDDFEDVLAITKKIQKIECVRYWTPRPVFLNRCAAAHL